MEPAYTPSIAPDSNLFYFLNSPPRPPSPATLRLESKLNQIVYNPQQTQVTNWDNSRVYTPNKSVGYRSKLGMQHVNGAATLFTSGYNSQGLIFDEQQHAAASVTTALKVTTDRKKESKGTYVQFDRDGFNYQNSDFRVTKVRKGQNRICYEGGHLIDYKFGVGNSHTTSENYFPQHHTVNAPLKEYVIQRSDAYIEIPLYTPNPPLVRVKGSTKYQAIPVGDLLVQINGSQISNIFYFPNNSFDYAGLRSRTPKQKNISEMLLPYFKLKPCFHALLHGAIVTNFKEVFLGREQQTTTEQHFLRVIDKITDGMIHEECVSEGEPISALTYLILHGNGKIDPSQIYNCDEPHLNNMRSEHIELPLKTLGGFLVTYAIKNSLKSEVISINSRQCFINAVIEFIEAAGDESSEGDLSFVDGLAYEFMQSFKELEEIRGTMTFQELLYFADAYRCLAANYDHPLLHEEHKVFLMKPETCLRRCINVLEQISQQFNVCYLTDDYAQNFLSLVMDAQKTIKHLIKRGSPSFLYNIELDVLDNLKDSCLFLYDKLPQSMFPLRLFRSNLKQQRFILTRSSAVLSKLEKLGSAAKRDDDTASPLNSSEDEVDSSYESDNSYEDLDETESSEETDESNSIDFLTEMRNDWESSSETDSEDES